MNTAREPASAGCAPASWTERMIRRFAGAMILISLLLAWQVHPGWLGLAAFVGLNLFQSSFTGFCPLEIVLKRIDARRGARVSPVTR
jgi:Inner membrane protein YgaP-like, transmembrane domain